MVKHVKSVDGVSDLSVTVAYLWSRLFLTANIQLTGSNDYTYIEKGPF